MTPIDRDHLAEVMATTVAPRLALAVHVRDRQQVADLLTDLTRTELYALAIVLADRVGNPRVRPDDGVVDEVAIRRAMAGEDIPLTPTERAHAVRQMAAAGQNPSTIATRLHMSGRRVKEILSETEAA